MIFARLEIVVPYGNVGTYAEAFSFRLPRGITAEKLTVVTRDADAVVQVRDDDGAFPQNPETTEQRCDRGFTSFVYVTPITGFRFRCYEPGKTTRVTFHAYG